VFSSPSASLTAVVEMQQALGAHEWPGDERLRVRMGVHSGEASETRAGLVGFEVHRAARIAAVAHGGQIVLSETSAALARNSLPVGASLRDLGVHRLKDLGRPERIFQLDAEGLEVDFPALRSLDNPEFANNLPGYLSAFVGREAELGEIRSLVERSRLVTLAGAGGSGKTRLALQVAAELLDGSDEGVWFVDLAPIEDSEQVGRAIAEVLDLREQPGRSPLHVLLDVLKSQNILIVLDNCEHVIDAAAKVADQLERNCPGVHLLATSREPLGIDGEQVYRVRPLSLPSEESETLRDLEGSDAVELFVARARAHDSTFVHDDSIARLVASICRRLDGIPFAIELAAARLASMSLTHLNERLDQRFRLLTGGARIALHRQQTLQATVDWSFDLLSPSEQTALSLLSVFVGDFNLEAAEAVCATKGLEAFEVADLVGSLVNKSLVVAERSSGSLRYRLLETIRQYASDRLTETSGEFGTGLARGTHAEFYLQLAETAEPELAGSPRQGVWLKRMDAEWDNIRAALSYFFSASDRTAEVLRFGIALRHFFGSRGHLEAVGSVRAALERTDPVPAALKARALCFTGEVLAYSLGFDSKAELRRAVDLLEESLEMARALDDRPLLVHALTLAGYWGANLEGESTRSILLREEALEVAREVGDPRLIGKALCHLVWLAPTPEKQRAVLLEGLALLRQGGDIYLAIPQLWSLAYLEVQDDRLDAARALYEEAILAAEGIGSAIDLAWSWVTLCSILLRQGEFDEAVVVGRKALIGGRRLGHRHVVARATFVLACCAASKGDYLRAARLAGAFGSIEAALPDAAPDSSDILSSRERQTLVDSLARVRQFVGEDEFERAVAAGGALSFEEAFDLALGKIRPT
jgi:predicted ATPase